jgi:hypothetical protein
MSNKYTIVSILPNDCASQFLKILTSVCIGLIASLNYPDFYGIVLNVRMLWFRSGIFSGCSSSSLGQLCGSCLWKINTALGCLVYWGKEVKRTQKCLSMGKKIYSFTVVVFSFFYLEHNR